MMNNKCGLCTRIPITTSKDKLLYEDQFCYIVENGNTDSYTKRITLVIVPHAIASPMIERIALCKLRKYVASTLHISHADFFIKKTMRTYPDHFHIHAYVLPRLK